MTPFNNSRNIKNILLLLFIVALAFPVFIHLEKLPIRIWDEARLAINSFEMSRNGNFLVTYYEGSPDHWNTKPPLLIWIQTSFIHLFGLGELAVRLPSAIAAFLTFILLIWFSRHYLKSYVPGLISAMVLATTDAYLNYHVARTADYDALLTLLMACMSLMIFMYSETSNSRYLYLFFIFLTLGVYTKSIQALLMLPGILIYLTWERKLVSLLKTRLFWMGTTLSAITILSYYLIRESYDPDYIKFVFMNEIGGRYLVTQEDHQQPFFFYFEQLINFRMPYWWLLFPCGIAAGMLSTEVRIRKISRFTLLIAISYLLVISNSKTKLAWYDAPAFPFLALGCGIFIYIIFLAIKNNIKTNKLLTYNILPYIFLLMIFTAPYIKLVDRNYMPKENWWETEYYYFSHYLKEVAEGNAETKANTICYDGHKAHLAFYIEILKTKGFDLEFKDYKKLKKGDIVLTEQAHIRDYIWANYNVSETWVSKNVGSFEIR